MAKRKKVESVLAYGEVTYHAHRLPSTVEVWENEDGTREFEPDEPVTLTHEEHKPITLPAVEQVSGIVREYDHFKEQARQVAD